MLSARKHRKGIALLTMMLLLITTFVPTGAFAATNSASEYIYKYIGTDDSNKGNTIYYKQNGKTKSGSTVMFKLRKDNSSVIDLAYCCDLQTYTQDNTYYKRTNIENAGYFEEDVARKIRNVVVNGYDPNNASASLQNLKNAANAWAKKNNRSTINSLSKENAITATQLAIWSLANDYMSPYSNTSAVTLVKDYLVSLPEVTPGPTEKVVESMAITADLFKDEDTNEATLKGGFIIYAGAVAAGDKVTPAGSDLALNIKAGNKSIYSGKLNNMISSGLVSLNEETLEYEYAISGLNASELKDGVNITIEFSGTQNLPKGAYFYKTPDRSDSQNFVGIAEWSNTINVKATAVANLTMTGKTDVAVTKVWNDNDNQDGNRPANIAVQLYADGSAKGDPVTLNEENNWEYEWSKLEKYDEGKAINYTVKEIGVPQGYTSEITGTAAEGFIITNSYKPAVTTISVDKVWDDNNDQDGIRPDSVNVQLFADGKASGEPVELTEEAGWTYTWTNLAKKAAGKAIAYTVAEADVPEDYTSEITGTAAEGFTITNSHKPAVTKVGVEKVWDDNNDQDGIRPESISVQLFADGEAFGEPVALTEEADWTYTWTDLTKNAAGKAIEYTVAETEVAEGYTSKITGTAAEGFTIKNTHTPETVDVEIEKIWEDLNNIEGIRSEEVKITLKADGEEIGSVSVNDINDWNDDWNDLPKYKNGKEIEYSITVDGIPEGYETEDVVKTVTEDGKIKFTVKSKYAPVTSISVEKDWDDADNQDGIRPEAVNVQLFADGEAYGDPVMLTEEAGWAYTWENLSKYSDEDNQAELIEYTVTEADVPEGYTSEIAGTAAEGYTITNSYTPAVTEVSVEKVWKDNDNQDGIRPESVLVQLFADGEAFGEPVELTAEAGWTYTWTDLTKNAAGVAIEYTVTEADIPEEYTSEITGTASEGFTITNSHTPEVTKVNVEKLWSDNDNQDGIRPESISVQLFADGEAFGEPVELTEEAGWTYTWTDLDKNAAGEEIEYTVTEADVPEEYTSEITGTAAEGYAIINSYTPAVTEVSVEKVWNDNDDQDGIRPESIPVQLFADGEAKGKAVVLSEENDWTYTWTDLAKNAAGEEIEYTIAESDVPDGYTSEITGSAAEGYIITNSYTPAVTTVSVEKEWNDNNDQDGIRPENVSVQLFADGEAKGDAVVLSAENDWAYTWTDLTKNAAGVAIEYTVTEADVPEGYTSEITGSAAEGYTITNSYTPAVTEVSVEKVWDDNDDQDGIRPESIKVQLFADGEVSGEPVDLTAEAGWTYTWTDLAKNAAGEMIEYTVAEVDVPEEYTSEITGSAAEGYTITNSYTPALTKVSVTKAWDDNNNQDGIRPESVSVQLFADGEAKGDAVVLSAENDWAYTWTDLAKKAAGEKIEYTVTETEVPEGYTSKIAGSAAEGYTITNSYTPAVTTVSVEKAWDDNNNQDGIRPESIKVQLFADGEVSGEPVELTEEAGWTYTWTDLAKKAAGEVIEYTVAETEVAEGYTSKIAGSAAEGFTITNSHTPAVTTVGVEKVWDDNDDQDGIRPGSVKVQLFADGEAKGEAVVLSTENDWTYTWADLAKNAAGEAIEYTVTETEVAEGYTSEITGTAAEGFTIKNTHTPETIDVEIEKIWEDLNNIEGIRSEEVKITLKADGEEVGSVSVNDINEWYDDWNNLPKYKNGKEIEYSITVDGIPEGYETEDIIKTITEDGKIKFTVKSKYAPVTSISVEKDWNDADNQDGIRPEYVKVQLFADGEAYGDPVMLTEEADWAYTWENLIKYSGEDDQAELIEYTVTEAEVPEDYTSEITGTAAEGYTITNSHTPAVTEVSVEKVWKDNDNQDGIRPESISVQLFADGEAEGEAVVLSTENDWTYTWTDLAKNAAGEVIEYTVAETEVAEGYTSKITGTAAEGYTITNSHTPAVITVGAVKVWDDNDDQDGIRPESVSVQLFADGEAKGEAVVLSAENDWTYTWADLAKNAAGKMIEYTVTEANVPDGYTSQITGTAAEGYTIKNTHTPETIDIEIEKIWEDLNNIEGLRSEEVKITLKANGEVVGSVSVNDINEWYDDWNGLPKYENGKEIEYSITVDGIPEGYVTEDIIKTITEDGKIKFTVKSKYAPVTSIAVKKDWNDADNQDGIRPEYVKVQLFADGEAYGDPVMLTEEAGWAYTWENLIKYSGEDDQAELIEYTVAEVEVPEGYTSEITGNAEEGYTITNTHEVKAAVIDNVIATGDDSCMILWMMMMLTSLAIMILVLVMNRRCKSQQA